MMGELYILFNIEPHNYTWRKLDAWHGPFFSLYGGRGGGMGVMGVPQLQKFLQAPVAIDAMVP